MFQGRHSRNARRRAQIQAHIFEEKLLLDAAILFHHEGVVGRCNEQHIEDAPLHQILKGRFFYIELAKVVCVHCNALSDHKNNKKR